MPPSGLNTTLKGHGKVVASVAFSPDGARLASGSWENTVKLWDVATGQELRTLKGHTDGISNVAFGPDGARLVSGSFDSLVKLRDAATGQELRTLKGHTAAVTSVAISPDGARVASGSNDFTVKLWDIATAQELRTLKGHTNIISGVAFSPDGAHVASGSFDSLVKLWDTATGQEQRTLKGHLQVVYGVAFSPDGARLASGSADNTVKLWDPSMGQELRTLKGHTLPVYGVAFSPDGGRLVSGSFDDTLKVWDARPLTPEVKTEVDAVALLDVHFARPLPQTEVRAVIERDNIEEATRQQALKLAGHYKEQTDPEKYYAAALPVIRHPYSNAFVLQFALAQMSASCDRAPENPTYRLDLGIAQYHLGKFQKERYPEALTTLQQCDQTHPTTLAFLFMTQHRLDQKYEAQATLARLRDVMKEPKWASDKQAQAFLREAEQLIEGG